MNGFYMMADLVFSRFRDQDIAKLYELNLKYNISKSAHQSTLCKTALGLYFFKKYYIKFDYQYRKICFFLSRSTNFLIKFNREYGKKLLDSIITECTSLKHLGNTFNFITTTCTSKWCSIHFIFQLDVCSFIRQ